MCDVNLADYIDFEFHFVYAWSTQDTVKGQLVSRVETSRKAAFPSSSCRERGVIDAEFYYEKKMLGSSSLRDTCDLCCFVLFAEEYSCVRVSVCLSVGVCVFGVCFSRLSI
eukprot:scpid92987/ scgid29386/ 